MGNLISCDFGTDTIYIHVGLSASIDTSFASPDSTPTGLTTDENDDMWSCGKTADDIWRHDGYTSSILDTYSAPAFLPSGLAYDGTNVISCDEGSDLIYIHDGKDAGTVSSSFASPDTSPSGLEFDGTDLYSCSYSGSPGRLFHHDGITSSLLETIDGTGSNMEGITKNSTDFITCDRSNNKITLHDGFSEDVQSDFASPSTNVSGVVWEPYSERIPGFTTSSWFM